MSRSRSVSDGYGTASRPPSSPAAYIDSRRPPEFHGSTAPCSIVLPGSGTTVVTSTSDRTPRPWQAGHAPEELNAKDSALGWSNCAPHTGQTISSPYVAIDGATRWPFGHRCEPSRDIIRRSTLSTSDMVPTVLRGPGTGGRCRRAGAGGGGAGPAPARRRGSGGRRRRRGCRALPAPLLA